MNKNTQSGYRRLSVVGALASLMLLSAPVRAEAIPPLVEGLCAGCHMPDGNSVDPVNPKLSGLDTKYIVRQLEDFKAGKRKNEIMDGIIAMVEPGDFKSLAKYFNSQKRNDGAPEKPELLEKGKQIYDEGVMATAAPACGGCHNEDGSGSDKFPRLNGQGPAYIKGQLMAFKNGTRTNDPKAVMQAVAKRLTEQEIEAVSEYIVTLKEAE